MAFQLGLALAASLLAAQTPRPRHPVTVLEQWRHIEIGHRGGERGSASVLPGGLATGGTVAVRDTPPQGRPSRREDPDRERRPESTPANREPADRGTRERRREPEARPDSRQPRSTGEPELRRRRRPDGDF